MGYKYHITKTHGYHTANQVFLPSNIAIAMSYFAVGFTNSFILTPLSIYLVYNLNAEPQMQTTISILSTIPWSLKLVFGFISDVFPIYGLHRKPYLTIGAIIYSLFSVLYAISEKDDVVLLAASLFISTLGMIMLDVMADTMCVERSRFEPDDIQGQMQSSYYSIRFGGGLIGSVLGTVVSNKDIWGWGLTFKQVLFINGCIPFFLICPFLFTLREKYRKVPLSLLEGGHSEMDLPVDERIPLHESIHSPRARSKAYSSMIKTTSTPDLRTNRQQLRNEENLLFKVSPKWNNNNNNNEIKTNNYGTYQKLSTTEDLSMPSSSYPSPLRRVKSSIHLPVQHFFLDIDEEDTSESSPLSKQCNDIWETVQLESVWRPMAFVYLFNALQVPNVAWKSYLILDLHFEPWALGAMVILGSFMTFAGVLGYKYYFFKSSWRKIYLWSVVLTTFFSLLQLMLIFQLNVKYLHISNYFFSLGDDVITAYISGIQFLPMCIMYMKLCPDGAEGASYSMLTTFSNIAGVCSNNLGNIFAGIWNVSNDAMKQNDISGFWKLHVLTSFISLFPLLFLYLLPKNEAEQERLRQNSKKSRMGGIIFLTVLFGSLFWSLSTAILKLTSNITDIDE